MIKDNEMHLYNEVLQSRKNNKTFKSAGKWMNLLNITLYEVTQTHKDKYHMCSLIAGFET